jgi:hypothetical protein
MIILRSTGSTMRWNAAAPASKCLASSAGKVEVLGGSAFFPFCSLKCKDEQGSTHYKDRKGQKKYMTIEECQVRIRAIIGQRKNNQAVPRLFS